MEVISLITGTMALCISIFCLGYIFANHKPKQETQPLTNEQKRKIEQEKREINNFWSYNGDPQSH